MPKCAQCYQGESKDGTHEQVWSPLHLNSKSLGGHKACTSTEQEEDPVGRVHPFVLCSVRHIHLTSVLPEAVNKQTRSRHSVSLTHIPLCQILPTLPSAAKHGTLLPSALGPALCLACDVFVGVGLALPVQGFAKSS